MIKLQNMNVIKYAESDEVAQRLVAKGFQIVESDDSPEATEPGKNAEKPLGKMTKDELLGRAKELGIDVPAEAIKADIIKAIEAVS